MMLSTALKRISSASSVSFEKLKLPVKSTINRFDYGKLNYCNSLPSASLQSRTCLAFSSSWSQLFLTSRSIFLLAARFKFFTFLWCSSDQQPKVTKMKIKIRRTKKETLEVNAKVLQSNVPIKYRTSDHVTALTTKKLISPRISSPRVVFVIFINAHRCYNKQCST